MKKLALISLLFMSCAKQDYVWMQRKVQLTNNGAMAIGEWQRLDTAHAQPIYQLKKISIKKMEGIR